MPLHPELPERRQLESRRTPVGGGSPPPQRNPRRHGEALSGELSDVQRERRIDSGIDPDLVFKIRTARSPVDSATLERRGVFVLGETADWTYFVLAPHPRRDRRSLVWFGATGEARTVVTAAVAAAVLMLIGGWLYRRKPS